jgi:hypothetical protein
MLGAYQLARLDEKKVRRKMLEGVIVLLVA